MTAGAAGILLASLAAPGVATAAQGLVGRSGTSLTLDGQPWRFVGFDEYQATADPDDGGYTCGSPTGTSDAQLDAAMQQVHDDGGTVLRTWFFEPYVEPQAADPYAAFDRVLGAAQRWDVKVVAVLTNQYADCMAGRPALTLADYQPGSAFWDSFRSYATAVAQHYRGDPTIAYWQLVNEPEAPESDGACDEGAAASALQAFATEMSSAVKGADPSHLISLGTLGSGQCGTANNGTVDDYSKVSSAPDIDLCEYHDYGAPTVAMPDDGHNGLAQRIAECKALGKPIVVGEAGIDAGSPCAPVSLSERAGEFQAKMTAAFSDGVAGYLPWELSTAPSCEAGADSQGHVYGIGPGDPTNAVLRSVAADIAYTAPPPAARTTRTAARGRPSSPRTAHTSDGRWVVAGLLVVAALLACSLTRRRRVRAS